MQSAILDDNLLIELGAKAAESPRLRVGYDLRTTPQDGSQRMINMLLPGTEVPIHRHQDTAETMVVVNGSITSVLYDDQCRVIARRRLTAGGPEFGIQIAAGQWHTVEVDEPCAIIEVKDGPYAPMTDIMNKPG